VDARAALALVGSGGERAACVAAALELLAAALASPSARRLAAELYGLVRLGAVAEVAYWVAYVIKYVLS
jgi:hypothetical protein